MPIDPGAETWRVFRIMAEFVEGFEVMSKVGPAVTIFGSARTHFNNRYYNAAEAVAEKLAASGLAVVTGGGPGIMEAGNRGAVKAKAKSVGLNIKLPQEQQGNRFQNVSIDFHYFYARKVMLAKYSSAFIYFPGGFGTLDELFEIVTLIQTLKMKPFPIVLYGKEYWSGLLDWVEKRLKDEFISPMDTQIFRIADSVDECVQIVHDGIREPWWKPGAIGVDESTLIPDMSKQDAMTEAEVIPMPPGLL